MTRNEKLLLGLDLDLATGIEIGALDKPIIPPTSPGAFYVDYADTQTLRTAYQNDPYVNVDNIVHVGGIWGEKGLAEIAAQVAPVDYLVASHVIEHVPDLITWLNEIESVLKSTGSVRLAIPDRRYSFDLLRTETVLADVLAAHLVRARVPQIREVIDCVANMAKVDCWHVWDGTIDRSSLEKYHAPEAIERLARDVLENKTYHDVHCWVFTPASFAHLMTRTAELGYHTFKCVEFFDTEHHTLEFFVIAQPGAAKDEAVASWLAMSKKLDKIERDIAAKEASKKAAEKAAELAAAVATRDAEIDGLRAEVAQLKSSVAQIKGSTSWRVTAPLRAIKSAVRPG